MVSKSKKILFVVPYPVGESPSQRFRFEQYFTYLPDAGFLFNVQSFWSLGTWKILYKKGYHFSKALGFIAGIGRRIKLLFSVRHYEFIFIHREAAPVGPPVIEWIISRLFKKKIIYDFDDAIWLPDPGPSNRILSFIKCYSKVSKICQLSYKVSCGNEYLVEFASQYNSSTYINPTTIDTERLHNPALFTAAHADPVITLGWTGSHSTLKYLKKISGVLENFIAQNTGSVNLLIIANAKPEFLNVPYSFLPWKKSTEIEDLLKIDIGLMPLTDDDWSKGKCGFKALQYMSLEKPTIASPVGINTRIINNEVDGYLCQTDKEWMDSLSTLTRDASLRLRMGSSARLKVINGYSVVSNVDNFRGLFL